MPVNIAASRDVKGLRGIRNAAWERGVACLLEFNVIGKSIPRVDAKEKALGRTKFGADMKLPGMLYAKVLRSQVPHGWLRSLDISKASAMPGVKAILTVKDVPGRNAYGTTIKDEPVLVADKIRKIGDPLALVLAETEKAAVLALEMIKTEIEELPGVFDPLLALEEGAPLVNQKSNLLVERKIVCGDTQQGFSKADYVVESEYRTHHQEHAYIEPEVSLAQAEGGLITVWASTQNPHYDRGEIAGNLGVNVNQVRVIQAPTGGGFGGKLDISTQILAALGALKTGCPVRLEYTREESMIASAKRHPAVIRVKTGATRDGKLVAIEEEIVADTGAYASYGPGVILRSMVHAAGPYEVPNVYIWVRLVHTNNPTCGAMRGFGVPQVAFAHEQQMDMLAEKIGMNPVEFRLLNCQKAGTVTPTGQHLLHSIGIEKTIEAVREKDEVRPKDCRGAKRYGRGIGCMWYGIGYTSLPNPSGAFVTVVEDGTAIVHTGCADIGQGSNTTFTQIAAEELGVEAADVYVYSADTGMTPDGGPTSASRQTYISGNAVKAAAANAKQIIHNMAAKLLNCEPGELSGYGGSIFVTDDPNRVVSFKEAIRKCYEQGSLPISSGHFVPQTTPLDAQGQGVPYATYAYASQIADIEVDTETGKVQVLGVRAAHDVGRAINPRNVEGQIEGGCVMGQGLALYEDLVVQDGEIKTPSFSTYLLPTTLDATNVDPVIVEEDEPSGPFGAKGVGEPSLIPTPAAIANAIYDAVGIRIKELPITPEKLLAQLKKKTS